MWKVWPPYCKSNYGTNIIILTYIIVNSKLSRENVLCLDAPRHLLFVQNLFSSREIFNTYAILLCTSPCHDLPTGFGALLWLDHRILKVKIREVNIFRRRMISTDWLIDWFKLSSFGSVATTYNTKIQKWCNSRVQKHVVLLNTYKLTYKVTLGMSHWLIYVSWLF